MAKVTCTISGIKMEMPEFSKLHINHTVGYIHPIFVANKKQLMALYKLYAKGECTAKESYLLFLALIHSTGKVKWNATVTLDWNSKSGQAFIANTINRLVNSLEKTSVIQHPKFKQPRFVVNMYNSDLSTIHNWVRAWRDNIEAFIANRISLDQHAKLVKVQNKLTHMILTDTSSPTYVTVLSEWAAMASNFPKEKEEEWKKAIRYCFNPKKIFSVNSSTLKEIKEHCETNLELDSIHYSEVMDCLKEGINNQINILGSSLLDLDAQVSLSMNEDSLAKAKLAKASIEKEEKLIGNIVSNAPTKEPVESDYPNKAAYIKAKVAYKIAASRK